MSLLSRIMFPQAECVPRNLHLLLMILLSEAEFTHALRFGVANFYNVHLNFMLLMVRAILYVHVRWTTSVLTCLAVNDNHNHALGSFPGDVQQSTPGVKSTMLSFPLSNKIRKSYQLP